MKKKLQLYISFIIILLGCSKHFDDVIIDTFDFSFTGKNEQSGFVYEELDSSFKISPTKQVDEASYFVEYEIMEGNGYFVDENGTPIDAAETEISTLNWKYRYVPLEEGDHKVMFTAKDFRGNEQLLEFDYDIDFAPFTVLLKGGANKYLVNKKNEVLLIMLSENVSAQLDSLAYKVTYSVDGGIGTIFREGEQLKAGKEFDFQSGNTVLGYLPENLGEHILTLHCVAPDGSEKEVSLPIVVDNTTFFMSAKGNSEGIVGKDFEIAVTLETTDLKEDVDYEMAYYFADDSEGTGTLTDQQETVIEEAGKNAIDPGQSLYRFNSDVAGVKKMYFDVSDSNNQIKRDSVVFDYVSKGFVFEAFTANEDIDLFQSVMVNLTLTGEEGPYSLYYENTSGEGTLSDQDEKALDDDSTVPIGTGNYGFSFVPSTLGENVLRFVVTDKDGIEQESLVNFKVGGSFGFSVISDKNTYTLDEEAKITMNVDGGDSYTLNYSSENSGVFTYNGTSYPPGSEIELNPGTSSGFYQVFEPGNYILNFTVLSDGAESRSGTVQFSFNGEEGAGGTVAFSVVPDNTSGNIDDIIGLTFEHNSTEPYLAKFTSSKTGVFSYGGDTVSPGQTFELDQGTSFGSWSGGEKGNTVLSFTIISQDGNEMFDTVSLTFNESAETNITFSANQDTNEVSVGETAGINFTLGGTEQYTAIYSNSESGSFEYNGVIVPPGESFAIARGNTLGFYTGDRPGNHSLNFVVTSTSGETASDAANVAYDVEVDRSITFSATEEDSGALIGEELDIDFNLIGNESYTASYSNSSSGVLVYNGSTIEQGQPFIISLGSSKADYSGTSAGDHELRFNILSNTGETASDVANISYTDSNVPVASVSVGPKDRNIVVGEGYNLNVTIEPASASNQEVSWSSSDSSVATVNDNGRVTGVSLGSAVITVTTVDGNMTDTATVNVGSTGIPVEGISVSPGEGTVNIGEDIELSETIVPANSTDQGTVWNSSDDSVATVDTDGTVTGVSEGTATVTVTTDDGGFTATTGITVNADTQTIAVTGILLNPETVDIVEGNSATLTATVEPSNASDRGLSWSSSDPNVVTIENGIVTGVSLGNATVTATTDDGGFTAESIVTVRSAVVNVTGVRINQGDTTIDVGDSSSFTADIIPATADATVIWSSDSDVATVDDNGAVTGISEGSAVITATADGFTDTVTVTVNSAPVDNTIVFDADAGASDFEAGENVNITLDLTGNQTYTATYSNSSSGTLVYNGTSVAPGETFDISTGTSVAIYNSSVEGDHSLGFEITSSSGENASDGVAFTYTVSDIPVTAVVINEGDRTIDIGGNLSFTADITPGDATDTEITWSSNDNAVTVDANGTVTGVSEGTAVITATAGGQTNSVTVTVQTAVVAATGVSVSPETATIGEGENIGLTATVSPTGADNTSVSWSSDDSTVATVDNSGTVRGVSEGTAVITAVIDDDGFTATATIAVSAATFEVTGITVDPSSATLVEGGSRTLTETVSPTGASNTDVIWTSSDTDVATVDDGVVIGISPGTSTITVTTEDGGFTATSEITVQLADVSVTGVNVSPSTATVSEGDNIDLTETVEPSDATNANVTWASSDDAVATVDGSGVVTGVSIGTATITATTEDGGFTAASEIMVQTATVAVTGISVSPTSRTITEGNDATLTPTVSPNNATNRNISWSSSDDTVATVNSSGVVTSVSTGTATITATTEDGGFTAAAEIRVQTATVAVTGVSVSPTSRTITEGNDATLTPTVIPSNATDQNVFWASSDNGVATVSNGVVTGVSAGIATITVTTRDGGFSDTSAITVQAATVAATGVSVSPASRTITEGNDTMLTPTVSPGNATDQTVSWSSSDDDVATVSNGVVTAISAGTAIITVTTTDGGFTATSSITVNAATVDVTGVSVSPTSASVTEGSTRSLSETVVPSNATNRNVSWSSSSLAVATVNGSGVVTGVSPGTATITVTTTDGGFTATSSITVNAATIGVTGVSVSPTSASVTEGSTRSLSESVSPSNATNQSVSWSSSNTGVATVSGSGVVTGVSPGTATITVTTADGGFTATSSITVNEATVDVTSVSVSPTSASVTEGSTRSLSETVSPSNATDQNVSWVSSNTGVATVSGSGVVTGVSPGTATITVTTTDGGFTATSSITVNAATVDVTGVSVSPTSVSVVEGSTTTLSETVAPDNATNRSVTWSSSSPGVATVSGSGVVTGVFPGTATITVTTVNGGFTAISNITIEAIIDTTIIFSANAPTGSFDEGTGVQINLNLQGEETYTATYSSNNSGTISYGGNTVNPGEIFDIRTGGSTAVYTGNSGGNHSIIFTVTSNTNVTENDSTTITYNSAPTSTIVVNNWSANETEEIGSGGSGSRIHENINISTSFMYTPLNIRAEIIDQSPSTSTSNELMPVPSVSIDDRLGPTVLNQSRTIPNGTNFTIYTNIPGERAVNQYEGAITKVRFYISNNVETITRDVTYTHL